MQFQSLGCLPEALTPPVDEGGMDEDEELVRDSLDEEEEEEAGAEAEEEEGDEEPSAAGRTVVRLPLASTLLTWRERLVGSPVSSGGCAEPTSSVSSGNLRFLS